MAFHMFCNAGYTMEIDVSGRQVNVTFEGLDFMEQCQEGTVRVNSANLCNNGRLNQNVFPLCENSCHTPPEDLECMRDFLPKTHNMLCRCKENCLPVDVKCPINKQWIYNKTICTESYSNMELRLFEPFGENVDFHYGDIVNPSVIASYTPIQNMRTYPEVQCTEEFKTLRPGQITCPRGKATVSRPPSCEKPCTTFPKNVSCEDTSEVNYLGSRTCTCLNSCQPVTITCDADGRWRDFLFPCSMTYINAEVTLSNAEKAFVSFTHETFTSGFASPIVQCSPGIKTLIPGILSCTDRNFTMTRRPSCARPCEGLPIGVRCSNEEDGQYKDTKICSCLNSCMPVNVSCLADGMWSDTNHICSNKYFEYNYTMPNGENVVINYNYEAETVFLNVTCPSGFKTKTNGKFTCVIGVLNTFHLPLCEIITSFLDINSIGSPFLYIFLFVGACIIMIVITFYVIINKKKRRRNTIEDDEAIYDDIDLKLVAQE